MITSLQQSDNNGCLPWLAILGTWICFGSFAVPMKWRSVVEAEVHPLIFQSYKTFWTFVTSHLVLFYQPYEFTWWGLLSGFLWVPAGVAAVVVVRHVGIAYGQPLWQVMIIATSFTWGFIILQDEAVYSWQATAAALACLVSGMLGMTISFAAFGERDSGHPKTYEGCLNSRTCEKSHRTWRPTAARACKRLLWHGYSKSSPRYEVVPKNQSNQSMGRPKALERSSSLPTGRSSRSAFIGMIAALFNGVLGGSCYIPSKYSPLQGIHFVISFATGALIANTVLVTSYIFLAKFSWRCSLPSPHFRVMALPGLLSGTLWSTGNFMSLYCFRSFGFAIGGTLIQCNVIVAGLWGILFYREITGKPVLYWLFCCATCLTGSFFLALQKKPIS